MADKVLRFTAEDSGYGQTIDRMAAKLRSAFSGAGGGMSDILQEADAKFTNFADKLRFIRGELGTIKEANEEERRMAVRDATQENTKAGSPRSNDAVQRELSKTYEREEKTIDRLIDSLDRFSDKVEANSEPGNPGEVPLPPKLPPKVPPEPEGGGGGAFGGGLIGGFLGGFLSGVGSQIVNGIKRAISEGTELERGELQLNRRIAYNRQFSDSTNNEFGRLGITNKQGLEAAANAEATGRYGTGDQLNAEVLRRFQLNKGYDIDFGQFGALDRFRRPNATGANSADINGFDASRTIIELLQRGARPGGLFDVNKNDFSLANEKVEQVTRLIADQYERTGTTDASGAINLILAGQRIGGRFAGNQAGEAFNNLANGIRNPGTPGLRSLEYAAIHRQHPEKDAYQVEAQLEGGATQENLNAILPIIRRYSLIAREAILKQLTGNATDAVALARGGSLDAILNTNGKPLTAGQVNGRITDAQTRGEKTTLEWDKTTTSFSNAVTNFGQSVAKFTNGSIQILKEQQARIDSLKANEIKTNKIVGATPGGNIMFIP